MTVDSVSKTLPVCSNKEVSQPYNCLYIHIAITLYGNDNNALKGVAIAIQPYYLSHACIYTCSHIGIFEGWQKEALPLLNLILPPNDAVVQENRQ